MISIKEQISSKGAVRWLPALAGALLVPLLSATAAFAQGAAPAQGPANVELYLNAFASLDRHEIAALGLTLGVVLFAVVTAILLAPTFMPTMRMEVSSNWFKLTDPEHLVFHTKRMLERGREVQELRQAVWDACSEQQYRPADVKVLRAKLSQLEAMLPAQSKVLQLPFENTASGFELFSDGAKALVPELSGYDGVDAVNQSAASTPTAA